MDVSQSKTVLKKPTAIQVALPTVAPLLVAVFSAEITMVIGDQYAWGAVPFVLVGWCVVLLGFAAWLNRVLFDRVRTFLPFLASISSIPLVWFWQRHAFTALVPKAGLTYGYFLTQEGAHARFWVLSCPFWVGLACLSGCFIVSLVLGWRAGARSLLACMIPWYLAAFVIFALPSMYLDGQGNGTLFI
ncbi:MAG: hypothetical protein NVS9B13_03510 [Candidatus Acidiferrum sp.]